MKGIILAGGKATRLYPITKGVCKQLLPVYDKPMIYYPMSVLMLAGIREILIISTPEDIGHFQRIFDDGSSLGISIQYKEQPKPEGIAQAFILAQDFIANDSVCLILGDNIFHGDKLGNLLNQSTQITEGANVYAYYVSQPQRYGVMEFDKKDQPISIVEKPKNPKSHWAVTGVYFFDNNVVNVAKNVKPSKRGELEITDVIDYYIKKNICQCVKLGRGFAWLDTGTYDSLLDASTYIKIIEDRVGLKIGCIEEIAFSKKYINQDQLLKIANQYNTSYGEYLKRLIK